MSDSSLNLAINISAIDSASNIIKNVGKAVSDMAKGDFAGAAMIAATAIVGIGAASVKMAGDFQSGITTLETGAGESKGNLQMVADGIKNLAVQTGTSTKQLTDGMFAIESAGYHGADGLNVLKAAAEGARAQNADLGTVAKGVTTILTDYHLGASQATNATNALVETVKSGNTHMQDLAGSMGSVLPLASSIGVSFPQVGGAIAVMTNAGMNAQRASTNLANALRSLSAPSGTATKSMAAVGIKAQDLKDTLTTKGLTAAIQMVEDHVGKKFPAGSVEAVTAFKNIMGGATGYNVALMLGGANMKIFEGNVKSISDAMKAGGSDIQGWSDVQGDFNFKLSQAQQAVNVLMINIGTTLLPVVGRAVDIFTALISGNSLGGFGPIMQDVQGTLGIMAYNFHDLANSTKPFQADLRQFGTLLGQLLPGFVSQALRMLDLLQLAFNSLAQGAGAIAGPALKILGQVIKGIQTAAEPVLNAIEGQLIPALQNIVSHVAPVIASILSWIANSGIIPVIFNIIGNVVGFVITAFSKLVDIGLKIIDFFTKTELGGALLKATLIALSIPVGILALAFIALVVQAVAGFIIAIPGMIAGFLAGAAGAWSMAMGVLAVAWPILLVIAVIALIILAIQHWGQIVKWLQGAWGAIASWFGGVLNGVKVWFIWLWTEIQIDLAKAWKAIQNAVKVALGVLVDIVMGPIYAIAGFFVWLYNHNTYFKKLVDAIVGFFKGCFAWLQNTWTATINWIVGAWRGLVAQATVLWDNVSMQIKIKFEQAVAFVESVWKKISDFFTNAWNTYIAKPLIALWTNVSTFFVNAWNNYVVGPLKTLWTNVSTVFTSAWNTYIASPLTDLWNSISKWFTDLGTHAMNSGKNFISMLVDGIRSGAGAIWNAVVSIANTIWKALGFHSPAKEGPGSDADTWMPNLINMLGSDLMAGIPKIQAAVNAVAQPLVALSSPEAAGPAATSQSNSSSNDIAIHIHLDGSGSGTDAQRRGKDIADVVKRELARTLRQQSIAPRYTSGGTHS